MKQNKLLALLLAGAMTVGCLSGCGQKNTPSQETSKTESKTESAQNTESAQSQVEEKLYYNKEGWYPICDEEITITVSGRTGVTKDWSKTLLVQTIKEEMGINMDITTYESDVWKTQLALMLAEDNLPDLVMAGEWDKDQSNAAGKDGYLLNLADYLDIMPNFAKALEENEDFRLYTYTPEGEIYGISYVKAARSSNNRNPIWYSQEDMEKYGFTADDIKTTDGFYEVLKSIKEQDPDRIPFGLTFDTNTACGAELYMRHAFGIYSNEFNFSTGVSEDGKVFLYETTENYKEYLKFMNRLYEEELIDQDSFIMTTDEYRAKAKNNDFVFLNAGDGLTTVRGMSTEELGEYNSISGFKSPLVEKSTYVYNSLVGTGTNIWVSADTKYPEAICRLLDMLFTDEGYILFSFGVEGKSFAYDDDGFGNMVPNDSALFNAETMPYQNKSEWKWQANVVNGMGTSFARHPRDMFITNATTEELEKVAVGPNASYQNYAKLELGIRYTCDDMIYVMPGLVYTEQETKDRASLVTDIKTYIQTMKAQFIRGEVDIDKEWDNFVGKIKEIGLEKLMGIEQAAYDRYAANKK